MVDVKDLGEADNSCDFLLAFLVLSGKRVYYETEELAAVLLVSIKYYMKTVLCI